MRGWCGKGLCQRLFCVLSWEVALGRRLRYLEVVGAIVRGKPDLERLSLYLRMHAYACVCMRGLWRHEHVLCRMHLVLSLLLVFMQAFNAILAVSIRTPAYMAPELINIRRGAWGYDGRRMDMRASGVLWVVMAFIEALAWLTRFDSGT